MVETLSQAGINAVLNQKSDPNKASDKIDKNESAEESSASKLNQDFNTFLQLLTTQLRYQDPTSPMDTKDFTNQVVLFSQVEQQINLNKKMQSLVTKTDDSFRTQAVNYIGKTVEAKGQDFDLKNGKASIEYVLEKEAREALVTIRDAQGDKMYEALVPTGAGEHPFVWDGRKKDGSTAPDGDYSFTVVAIDKDRKSVPVTHITNREITGVKFEDGAVQLEAGNATWDLKDVRRIRS